MLMRHLDVFAELVRAPAALTVPGDIVAGASAAGWPYGVRAGGGLAAASVLLYWGGMALNDYADREVDAVERPGRPVPSGRVSPRAALATAAALTAAGLGTAAAAGGRRALGTALPLAATAWAYDLALKDTPLGAPAMAAARGLDVLLAAGPTGRRAAAPAAAAVAAHTGIVMALSRREAQGSSHALPEATLAATAALAAAVALAPGGRGGRHRAASAALLCLYGRTFGGAQFAAIRKPDARRLQGAVRAGILGVIPLQAALAGRAGATRAALPLLAALPLARRLSRKVSPT
ncbi:SCO3242 family prenyltransferase [Streptomyces sp. NPDC049040]|uniref:SCO3242 family prenyltransferase n=1 Tax=Streptomyces sp. NPDC049040 TaxID=3365593 RepID=UPI003721C565